MSLSDLKLKGYDTWEVFKVCMGFKAMLDHLWLFRYWLCKVVLI